MYTVSSSRETEFPGLLNTMAVTDDEKVWMGGKDNILKLFDLQENIQRTLKIPCCSRLYICMHNGQVVFSDTANKTIHKISQDNDVVTLFKTGNWKPYGVKDTASGHLLLSLRNDDQSKVVRYSGTGSVLQVFQFDLPTPL